MEFSLVTVSVKDMEKSIAFYNGVLGLEIISQRAGGSGSQLAFLGKEGQPQIELVYNPANEDISYAGFSIGFYIDSTEEALKLMENNGYTPASSVSPNPQVKITRFFDPNGITVALIEHK